MVEKYYKTPRKRLRLEGYDYSQDGLYFVTICTHGRLVMFDQPQVVKMVEEFWCKMPSKFQGLVLDEFIVMPNHLHGIIQIVGADPCVGPLNHTSVSKAIQWFKTMSTNAYLRGVKSDGWRLCHEKLWQRGFYDRIIRSEEELNTFRVYIQDNPGRWEEDIENIGAE